MGHAAKPVSVWFGHAAKPVSIWKNWTCRFCLCGRYKYSYLGERDMECSGGVGLQVKGIAQQSSPSRHWPRKTKQK
jgi:hypothetical protein